MLFFTLYKNSHQIINTGMVYGTHYKIYILLSIKWHWNGAIFIYLHSAHCCFHTFIMEDLRVSKQPMQLTKVKIFTLWFFSQVLPPLTWT